METFIAKEQAHLKQGWSLKGRDHTQGGLLEPSSCFEAAAPSSAGGC